MYTLPWFVGVISLVAIGASATVPDFVANHKLPIHPYAPPATLYCANREDWNVVLQVLPSDGFLTVTNQKFSCRVGLTTSWDASGSGNVTFSQQPGALCSEGATSSFNQCFFLAL